MYRLINERYGRESVEVTADELRSMLIDVYGDHNTEVVERADGIYDSTGEMVAIAEPSNDTIRLSDMSVGDRGWLESESAVVELMDGGLSGGCDNDLYLGLVSYDIDDSLPLIVVDTDEVSI